MDHSSPLSRPWLAAWCWPICLACWQAARESPPMVGYLAAGVVCGPFTPGYVADLQLAPRLAEIGVILLMFGVGLHFSPQGICCRSHTPSRGHSPDHPGNPARARPLPVARLEPDRRPGVWSGPLHRQHCGAAPWRAEDRSTPRRGASPSAGSSWRICDGAGPGTAPHPRQPTAGARH